MYFSELKERSNQHVLVVGLCNFVYFALVLLENFVYTFSAIHYIHYKFIYINGEIIINSANIF